MSIALQQKSPPAAHSGSAIRVLIVDDSVVARAVLARMVGERPGFEVVGQADGAAAALRIVDTTAVDIILLDLEMPGVDGLAALPELIARSRGARVMIVSSACADGGATTIAALADGAADTMLKPGVAALSGRFGDDLIERMRRIGQAPRVTAMPSPPQGRQETPAGAASRALECVGIGASTGGVHALTTFFAHLPASFAVPILITQHLPVPFMPYFADQLVEITGRPTRLAAAGMRPAAGEILLAPGDAHLTVARMAGIAHVRLERRRAPSGCLPSIDPMFASIGRTYGSAAIGIMLSGMGRDGAAGAETLVQEGGAVLAQDAATSVVWGMPGAVANAGLAHAVLPPDAIAKAVADWNADRNKGSTVRWK